MKLIYDTSGNGGSAYSHDEDEVGVRIQYRSIFDKFHRRMGQIETWHVVGVKQAASQSALTTALSNLEAAYLIDFGDLTLKDNSNVNSQHLVANANTFSGVQVAHFSYPQGGWDMQTEYANKRTYQVILTAETRFGGATELYAYRERIRQVGTGGSLRRYMGSLTGTPVLQTLRVFTPIRYIQEGYVIGRGTTLTAPTPLALGNEMFEQRIIEVGTPMDIRVGGAELYKTSYRYVMENTSTGTITPSTNTINPL